MKGRVIALDHLWGHEAAALMVDGQLQDILIDPSAVSPLPPGTICRGTVDRLMKGQGGVFLRLPEGQRGFLREVKGLSEGQSVIVQVSGSAEDGKALPLSQRLLFRGRTGIATPGAPGVNVSRRIKEEDARSELTAIGQSALRDAGASEGMGLVIRTAAMLASDDEVAEELTALATLAAQVTADQTGEPEVLVDADSPWRAAWIDWSDPDPDEVDEGEGSFDRHAVTDAVDALLVPQIDLDGGASAFVEVTRALIAVDVNTGRDTSPAAALKANIALARDLPRQLRLRGLGGQVVIDFAPISKRDRGTLDQTLRAAFRSDGAETNLVGWTAMGLYELSRKRDRMPLSRLATAQ
ncbi:MAG: ribonuclease G [Paracoccus denitrificans]|nr:MAG: ribonuclease G [Paracoccus denitrificans]PZO83674.1 MAG: ribonuclease G [Paracoccus denitrificans]